MTDINAYEKYRRPEDLPVKLKVVMPPEGMLRKGIIQFHHGMSEHKGRYAAVMDFFAANGYICAIHDVRGHGESMENDSELGYIGEDGANLIVEDAHAVTIYLKNNYPDLPVILVGHSFGSMVARAYIKKYDYEIDRAFIVGCPGNNKMKAFGMLLIELMTVFKSDKEVSAFVGSMFNGRYEKKYKKLCEKNHKVFVKNGQICSDEEVVKSYNSDRKSGFTYTLNGYYTIMETMAKVYNGSADKWVRKNKKLHITFLSGEDDMYMLGKKTFMQAVDRMRSIGYENTDYKLYPGMYHEILNEKGKEQVYEDMLDMMSEPDRQSASVR